MGESSSNWINLDSLKIRKEIKRIFSLQRFELYTDFSFMKSSGRSFKRLSLTQMSKCSIVSCPKGENKKIRKTNHAKILLCCTDAQQLYHREIHQPVSYCNPATDVSNTFTLQQCSTFTSSSAS